LQGGLLPEGNGVYYDSQNPVMNALEDFSEKSRNDRKFAYTLLFVAPLWGPSSFMQRHPIGMNPTSELPESGCFGNDNRCGA
jgi:hypothetical protein